MYLGGHRRVPAACERQWPSHEYDLWARGAADYVLTGTSWDVTVAAIDTCWIRVATNWPFGFRPDLSMELPSPRARRIERDQGLPCHKANHSSASIAPVSSSALDYRPQCRLHWPGFHTRRAGSRVGAGAVVEITVHLRYGGHIIFLRSHFTSLYPPLVDNVHGRKRGLDLQQSV